MEVDMDLQEKHTKEEEQDELDKGEEDESERPKSKSIYVVEIMEGKREKKTVQRLDMQVPKPKEKLKIESIGKGDKLGDIPRVNHAIGRLKAPLLKPLHKIVYDRPGAVASLRKHLRLFNGFPFEIDSDSYIKKKTKMLKLPKVQLKSICQILDIERSGSQAVLADRIMQFLANPTNSGKPVILKKKRKKKTAKDAKREKKTSSKSKKQQTDTGKSKEIVTDSSSDDEDDDDDEDEGDIKNKETEKASDSQKHKEEESDSEDEDNEESDDGLGDSEDEEKSMKSSNKKKSTPKKTAKKTEDNSDLSASDDDDDESAEEVAPKKTKKKPSAPKKKPAPKTKKADSSSNRKRKDASKSKAKIESSDEDDQPLIKLIKKPPTNEQLQDKIKDLLKTVNLEEVTMKQICQQVYDLYPDFDLTDRKDVIKETVKSLIS